MSVVAPKVLILNGPPRCGKDTLKDYILEKFPHETASIRFAEPLKLGVHALLAIDDFGKCEFFTTVKDEPNEQFFGWKPRDVYIEASEQFLKPLFGADIFGKLWVRTYEKKYGKRDYPPVMVITDCGFLDEIKPIVNKFGPENCTFFRIHRAGFDYSRDSRDYIYPEGISEWAKMKTYDISNITNKQDLYFAEAFEALEHSGILASL